MSRAVIMWVLLLTFLRGRSQLGADQSGNTTARVKVFGCVTDSAASPLPNATVQLISERDTFGTRTGNEGKFIFEGIRARTFRLTVTMKGYMPFVQTVTVGNGKAYVDFPALILHINYEDMAPVIVSRVRPTTVSGDTINYNTSAFPVREGSEVEAILRHLPGIDVDLDGNLIVQGKKVTKVTVNGKDFFGGDVLLAIRNLPADIVSKLQIIDDYGDKARLTGIKTDDPAKVLNIVLKPDKRWGTFGHVEAGAGNEGKYAEEGFGNVFHEERQVSVKVDAKDDNLAGRNPNEQFAGSYADLWSPRWRAAFNTSANMDKSRTVSGVVQQSFYPGQQIKLVENSNGQAHVSNINLGGMLNWSAANSSLLRITPTFGIRSSTGRSVIDLISNEIDSGFSKEMNGMAINLVSSRGWNAGNELYFERASPGSRLRVSIDAAISYVAQNISTGYQSHSAIVEDGHLSQSAEKYVLVNSARNMEFHFKANNYYRLNPANLLEFGYLVRSGAFKNDRITQSPDSITGAMVTVDSLSAVEPYSTISQRFHSGYEGLLGKLVISATLDGEWGQLSGLGGQQEGKYTYRFFNLLPGSQAHFRFNRNHSVTFYYQGSSSIPTMQEVNPVKDLSNPQYPVIGNPKLRPSITQSANIDYEYTHLAAANFAGFGLTAGYSLTPDPVITAIIHPRDSSQVIQRTTYLNSGRIVSFSAGYHFTLPAIWQKFFRVTATGAIAGNQSPVLTDGLKYDIKTFTWDQAVHLQLSIRQKLDLDFEGNYTAVHSSLPAGSQFPATVQTANLQLGGRQLLCNSWSASYRLIQPYVSTGSRLHASTMMLTASLQRDFLSHNRASVTVTGYNLLNGNAPINETVTSTDITQIHSNLIGRFYLLKLTLKLERFQ